VAAEVVTETPPADIEAEMTEKPEIGGDVVDEEEKNA
jgi:hypothetical protein